MAVGIFGFDAAHGRCNGLFLDLLDPCIPLVNGIRTKDGVHVGPVLQAPRYPVRARFLGLISAIPLTRGTRYRLGGPHGIGSVGP